MSWDDFKADINAAVADTFGSDGVYTSIDGGTVQVNAIVDNGILRAGFDSDLSVPHDELSFRSIDICNPQRGDEYFDGKDTYTFVSPLLDDEQFPVWLVRRGDT